MSKIIFNNDDRYIEICELPEEDLAGKTKIKMSALKIHESSEEYNDNGLNWNEQFVKDNLKSIIGSPYVVSWLDEENQIPSDHGEMSYDEEGNLVFDGVAVGTIIDAFIETVEIDGINTKVLMTEGYIFKQRYSKFVDWLKYEIENGKVYGSIEINGKGKSKSIEYLDGGTNEDGTLKVPRTPTVFDFTALAILYIVNPADKNSIVFEVNSKEGENKNMTGKTENIIELNAMNYEDISILVEKSFNNKFNEGKQYYTWFYPHKFYPTISTFIMKSWDKIGEYYKTTYSIEDGVLKISEIIKVEEDWKPVGNEQSVEVNTPIKKIIKGGNANMEELIREKDKKIEELTAQLTEVNAKNAELTSKVEELEGKATELNATIVEVNKTLEDIKKEKETLVTEVNSLKEYKENKEQEIKKAEVNSYFETEIPKNNFEEAEVNTLKEYVEKCDLEGLKKAEADLIVKRFKEGKLTGVEVNSNKDGNVFFHTKEEKIDDIEAGKALFN